MERLWALSRGAAEGYAAENADSHARVLVRMVGVSPPDKGVRCERQIMSHSKIIATLLITVVPTVAAGGLKAQAGAGRPVWETLLQEPLPEDSEPQVSVFSLPVGPA